MPAEVWTRGLVGMLLCDHPQGCTRAVFIEALLTFGEPLFSGVNSSILNRSRSLSGHALVNALGRSSGVASGRASPTIVFRSTLGLMVDGRTSTPFRSTHFRVGSFSRRILPPISTIERKPRIARSSRSAMLCDELFFPRSVVSPIYLVYDLSDAGLNEENEPSSSDSSRGTYGSSDVGWQNSWRGRRGMISVLHVCKRAGTRASRGG